MTQLNIKKYFKIKKEKLRRAVIEHGYEPLSLRIVDTTNDDVDNVIYIARSLKTLIIKVYTLYLKIRTEQISSSAQRNFKKESRIMIGFIAVLLLYAWMCLADKK